MGAYTRRVNILILACSLNPDSRSALLADAAAAALRDRLAEVEVVDLREVELPLCDGGSAYAAPAVGELAAKISAADAVLLAVPIYNYDVNAAAKNLIELTGRAWTNQVVGFLCAAGGKSSYMSVMPVANSLMLDFRCLILPRFVYATGDDFDGDALREPIQQRVDQLAEDTHRLALALQTSDAPA